MGKKREGLREGEREKERRTGGRKIRKGEGREGRQIWGNRENEIRREEEKTGSRAE